MRHVSCDSLLPPGYILSLFSFFSFQGSLLLYAEQYHDNKPYQDKYKKSKDPDRYLRMHETQLILYDGAERMFQKMGLEPKSVNPAEIRSDYEAMQAHKIMLESAYKSAEKEALSLRENMTNIVQYIGHL